MASLKNFARMPNGARSVSDHVNARDTVTTSEQISIPTGANLVLLNGSGPFAFAFGTNPTAVFPSADVDDGSANEIVNPASPDDCRLFVIPSGSTKLAVAAGTAADITAAFFIN